MLGKEHVFKDGDKKETNSKPIAANPKSKTTKEERQNANIDIIN